ncbi:MAG: LysR family transcriptional regulator [Candidatus Dactylopiibacterium carminicum]|uniref:LysR family transcriptional regulator n=1 Tax=Candidatus Dactylopiibacterium carminicum TaxID=857335 RepID=A0A272ESW2_9RHOO|nr:LysR family transcriptional regulator [Candidatus Dactylopiibacterium carminicum]KAF7600739.1 LysR family transcriptional regulator [Candidatus Dactylopiibacterium carminicum]PAS93192.1 MAG: LysR family transcriptional regulator [Candidatus Dactylopiibacterium carminicum]PAT00746.1 MAG: LysR family transcriptional regulator [Candidatus Dactylopiibacterium carminicum]
MNVPLNALRAFEASARHLSFTLAAQELNVTQAAVSQQVKNLEARLNTQLFRRLPRGLLLTDEGLALLPALSDAFGRLSAVLQQFEGGRVREVLNLAVVGTFAAGWLLPRLVGFRQIHLFIDLRVFTHNNRVDLAAEGLDFAIRFGDGAWRGMGAEMLVEAQMAPLCAPRLATTLKTPADLLGHELLRSYRADEWSRWFAAAGLPDPLIHGPVFDSSLAMADVAMQGLGVALLPLAMFERPLREGLLVQAFDLTVTTGQYWLTWQKSRPHTRAMRDLHEWLSDQARNTHSPATTRV